MGLARWLTPESMGVLTGETGTYLYMSPEMIRHELYNSRTDVYSWGVLLVELITQKIPYEDQHLTPLQVVFRTGSQPQHCNAVDHMSHPSSSLITQAS